LNHLNVKDLARGYFGNVPEPLKEVLSHFALV